MIFLYSFLSERKDTDVGEGREKGEAFVLAADVGCLSGRFGFTCRGAESVLGSGYDSQQSGSLEARQIRAIVEGMKQELREFIANDKHTIVEYGQRLVQRQDQEIEYYNRAKSEIDAAVEARMPQDELLSLWESRNAQLRNIGVKLVPLPED